jgi:hypothetical protein
MKLNKINLNDTDPDPEISLMKFKKINLNDTDPDL